MVHLPGQNTSEAKLGGRQGTKELCVLLGAGFSRWAADLPVSAESFDFALEPFGVRDRQKLTTIRLEKASWDEYHPQATAEQFIADALRSEHRVRSALLWYIVRRVSDPYIWREWQSGRWRRQVLMIDENRRFASPGVTLARSFLVHLLPRLSGIISTNYDMLVEYALGTRLFNYGRRGEVLAGRGPYPISQWRNPVTLTGYLAFAKMHGSTSWGMDKQRYTDGRRGITGDALIVAPSPEKTPPAALAAEWRLASRILQRAESILAFGFAFNPYDEALLTHLRINGDGIRRAILVDINPQPSRAAAVFPQASVRVLRPPNREAPLDDWQSELAALLGWG